MKKWQIYKCNHISNDLKGQWNKYPHEKAEALRMDKKARPNDMSLSFTLKIKTQVGDDKPNTLLVTFTQYKHTDLGKILNAGPFPHT